MSNTTINVQKECTYIQFQNYCNQALKEDRWGSCQYADAQAIFDKLQSVEDFDALFKQFDISVEFGNAVTDLKSIIASVMNEYNQKVQDFSDDDAEYRLDINKITNLDDLFTQLRGNAYDLWTALELVFKHVFPNAKISGTGPKMLKSRKLIYFNNVLPGIQAWALVKFGLVRTDECYKSFDT